jgi:ABC-type multidrug transport system ATPase subunit
MLTGILQPDSGIINICGYDYYNEMSLIRNKTGVCLQIDVLYDELTVREQLEFFANIKGIPAEKMERTVDEMINRCGLID